jgi:hypothetical protein
VQIEILTAFPSIFPLYTQANPPLLNVRVSSNVTLPVTLMGLFFFISSSRSPKLLRLSILVRLLRLFDLEKSMALVVFFRLSARTAGMGTGDEDEAEEIGKRAAGADEDRISAPKDGLLATTALAPIAIEATTEFMLLDGVDTAAVGGGEGVGVGVGNGVGVCVVTKVIFEEIGGFRELGELAGSWNVTVGGDGGDAAAG